MAQDPDTPPILAKAFGPIRPTSRALNRRVYLGRGRAILCDLLDPFGEAELRPNGTVVEVINFREEGFEHDTIFELVPWELPEGTIYSIWAVGLDDAR